MILAIDDAAVVVWRDGQRVTVNISAGDIMCFGGQVRHGGTAYGQNALRLFAYVLQDEYLLPANTTDLATEPGEPLQLPSPVAVLPQEVISALSQCSDVNLGDGAANNVPSAWMDQLLAALCRPSPPPPRCSSVLVIGVEVGHVCDWIMVAMAARDMTWSLMATDAGAGFHSLSEAVSKVAHLVPNIVPVLKGPFESWLVHSDPDVTAGSTSLKRHDVIALPPAPAPSGSEPAPGPEPDFSSTAASGSGSGSGSGANGVGLPVALVDYSSSSESEASEDVPVTPPSSDQLGSGPSPVSGLLGCALHAALVWHGVVVSPAVLDVAAANRALTSQLSQSHPSSDQRGAIPLIDVNAWGTDVPTDIAYVAHTPVRLVEDGGDTTTHARNVHFTEEGVTVIPARTVHASLGRVGGVGAIMSLRAGTVPESAGMRSERADLLRAMRRLADKERKKAKPGQSAGVPGGQHAEEEEPAMKRARPPVQPAPTSTNQLVFELSYVDADGGCCVRAAHVILTLSGDQRTLEEVFAAHACQHKAGANVSWDTNTRSQRQMTRHYTFPPTFREYCRKFFDSEWLAACPSLWYSVDGVLTSCEFDPTTCLVLDGGDNIQGDLRYPSQHGQTTRASAESFVTDGTLTDGFLQPGVDYVVICAALSPKMSRHWFPGSVRQREPAPATFSVPELSTKNQRRAAPAPPTTALNTEGGPHDAEAEACDASCGASDTEDEPCEASDTEDEPCKASEASEARPSKRQDGGTTGTGSSGKRRKEESPAPPAGKGKGKLQRRYDTKPGYDVRKGTDSYTVTNTEINSSVTFFRNCVSRDVWADIWNFEGVTISETDAVVAEADPEHPMPEDCLHQTGTGGFGVGEYTAEMTLTLPSRLSAAVKDTPLTKKDLAAILQANSSPHLRVVDVVHPFDDDEVLLGRFLAAKFSRNGFDLAGVMGDVAAAQAGRTIGRAQPKQQRQRSVAEHAHPQGAASTGYDIDAVMRDVKAAREGATTGSARPTKRGSSSAAGPARGRGSSMSGTAMVGERVVRDSLLDDVAIGGARLVEYPQPYSGRRCYPGVGLADRQRAYPSHSLATSPYSCAADSIYAATGGSQALAPELLCRIDEGHPGHLAPGTPREHWAKGVQLFSPGVTGAINRAGYQLSHIDHTPLPWGNMDEESAFDAAIAASLDEDSALHAAIAVSLADQTRPQNVDEDSALDAAIAASLADQPRPARSGQPPQPSRRRQPRHRGKRNSQRRRGRGKEGTTPTMQQLLLQPAGVYLAEFWYQKGSVEDYHIVAVNCSFRYLYCNTLGYIPFSCRNSAGDLAAKGESQETHANVIGFLGDTHEVCNVWQITRTPANIVPDTVDGATRRQNSTRHALHSDT